MKVPEDAGEAAAWDAGTAAFAFCWLLEAFIRRHVSGEVRILECPFELEGGDLGGEAGDNHGHFPWLKASPRCFDGAAGRDAVVLSQPAKRVRS